MVLDHYATLGISPQANLAEIKMAYRNLAKQFHPDIVGNDASKLQYFSEIKLAYETLMNPALRYQYHEQRWLLKSQGLQFEVPKIINSTTILKDCLQLEKEVHFMDSKHSTETIIATKLSEILNQKNIEILHQQNDRDVNQTIFFTIEKLVPFLPLSYLPIIEKKMAALDFEDNQKNMQLLATKIKERRISIAIEKYKWIGVIVLTLILLWIMRIAAN